MDKLPLSVYDFFGYLASGFLIVAAFDYVQPHPAILRENVGVFPGAFWILAAYVTGHLVATLSSSLYERFLVGVWLGRPSRNLFEDRRRGWRTALFWAYLTPFSPRTAARIRARAGQDSELEGEDLFLLAFGEAKRHPDVLTRLNTFLNLYGFARNVSCAAFVAGAVVLVGAFVDPRVDTEAALRWALVALVVWVGMFYRYLKFLRQYSYELFVSWAALPPNEELR